jgi:hypothetical protein
VFHYSCDGDILVLESDEARDQDEYLDNKRSRDKHLLDKMNAAVVKEFGGDESKKILYINTFRRQGRSS